MPFMEMMVKRLNIFENRMMKQYKGEIKNYFKNKPLFRKYRPIPKALALER